jgi:hypothetical protein
MSETVSLDALGVLLRRMQVDVSAMSVKLDLLTRGRERDLTALATRDDLRDVLAAVLADQLADFDLRISGAVGQLAEQMTSTQKTLNDILDRQA